MAEAYGNTTELLPKTETPNKIIIASNEQTSSAISSAQDFLRNQTITFGKGLTTQQQKVYQETINDDEDNQRIALLQMRLNAIEKKRGQLIQVTLQQYQEVSKHGGTENFKQIAIQNFPNLEGLSQSEKVRQLQKFSYDIFGINTDTYSNNIARQFIKGVIDSVIVGNGELIEKIIETKGGILIDIIESVFTKEGLENIANALGQSIGDLFSGDAYKTGKSVGDLGLISTGAGATAMGIKKMFKTGVKGVEHAGAKEVGKATEHVISLETQKVYERYPQLQAHREFLGEITESDIINRGENGIIVKPRNPDLQEDVVVKIPFNEYDIAELRKNISKYDRLASIIEKGIREGSIPDWIKVPYIYEGINEGKPYFIMEKIKGQSLHTHYLLDKYKDLLKDTKIEGITENQIRDILERDHGIEEVLLRMPNDEAIDYISAHFPEKYEDFKKAIEYLRSKGIKHTDLHTGNVMVDNRGNFYIIDFDSIQFLN